ncbi:MAG TPA: ATP-binding cassette domain-containing protein [Lacipirellulaceae bacterium]|jgi:ATP-binding cassette subfamily F protein uup|nr:ATP-binding cassette domain-containing protein [Lacipirellulaceae bacterium]
MPPLVQLNGVSIGFRGPALLDDVTCQIETRQRIGLLGRNGSGKTTLMRLIAGEIAPDHGARVVMPGAKISLLPQEVPSDLAGNIHDVVLHGLPAAELDDAHLWQSQQRVDRLLTQMGLDSDIETSTLSSGMKRRVLLARALVAEPDVLLLDEPTNHLDIDAIRWLEDFLLRWRTTLIFVTHDRAFLRRLATRIIELDRGRLFDWSCDYDTFLVRKEAALAAEEKQNALFDKKLAQEEAWLRQGIKARRTRNEGRVKALKQLRVVRSERRDVVGKAKLDIQSADRSGALVAKVQGISFAYGDREIVQGFSTTIMRGDKIGLIGPNGVGKTTLLRLLLGQLAPQLGTVRLGTNLQIAYFDQLRQQLDDEATVQENLGLGGETVSIGGSSRHVLGYLQDFLFTPDRARTAVRFLSGGERNRLLLARLFTKPANVLVLDEPTNDLDAETLELLEERLVEFDGTVLLVSHDREFLNNVVTSTIAFEPGGVREYVGGYDDWIRQRAEAIEEDATDGPSVRKSKVGEPMSAALAESPKRKLAFRERRELDLLPKKIEELDAKLAELHEAVGRPDFYKQPAAEIAKQQSEAKDVQQQLDAAYARWEELEAE